MKIQLDIPYIVDLPDNSIPSQSGIEYSKSFAAKHNCTARTVLENGPAGGNPLIEFSSDNIDDLKSLIREYDGDNGDFEYLIQHITE